MGCCALSPHTSAPRASDVTPLPHFHNVAPPPLLPHPQPQTAAISLAAKYGQLVHALAVYRLMLRDGVEPKSPTFNARE